MFIFNSYLEDHQKNEYLHLGLHDLLSADLLSIDYFQGKNIFFAVKDLLSIDYIKISYQ